jgi:hypothetical protein
LEIRNDYIETLREIVVMVINRNEDWIILEYLLNKLVQLGDTEAIEHQKIIIEILRSI